MNIPFHQLCHAQYLSQQRSNFLNEIISDTPIHLFITSFYILAVLISSYFKKSNSNLLQKMPDFISIHDISAAIFFVLLSLSITTFIRVVVQGPKSPIKSFMAKMRFAIIRIPATALLLVNITLFIQAFSSLKALLPSYSLIWADEYLASIDRSTFGGQDAWDLLSPFKLPDIFKDIQQFYVVGWSLSIYLISTIASICSRPLRHRYFFSFILAWIIQGLFIPVLFFSGGPAFYGPFTGDFMRFDKISNFLAKFSGSEFSAYDIQVWLLDLYIAEKSQFGSGISAFPSVHVALASLFSLFAWSVNSILGIIMAIFCGIIMTGAVLLGWHYAIDCYVAIVLELVIWWTCGILFMLPHTENVTPKATNNGMKQ